MVTRENTLSERERHILSALSLDPDATTSRRAQALLEWAQGEPREQIAQTTGLRPAQVQALTRAFAQKRLEVFAHSSLERASRGLSGRITIDTLMQERQVDQAHARYVTASALQILDSTLAVHQLRPDWRSLLEAGALLHNIGVAGHDDHQQHTGRDIVLAYELEGFSARDRDVIACLVRFHRKKVKAAHDPIFADLDPEAQRATLILAAILRIADGLDHSQTQSTALLSIQVNSLVDAIVEGPQAEMDARRANKRADLWREVLAPPFHARLADDSTPTPVLRKRPKLKSGVDSHESIAKAGRKIVGTQFAKLQSLEDQVRAGSEIEAVHDMRVATRRMRSAFRLLARFYPKKTLNKLRPTVRELAGDLGKVRDLDVMIENLRAYSGTLALEQQRALDPLLADWQARRAQAQRALVELLDSQEYDDWLARVEDFIEAKDKAESSQVAEVVPALIWKRYGAVREYEGRLKQPTLSQLHRLRIECKRLRYALEFFAEAMGDHTGLLLESLVALQDHLGALHDADMARQLVTDFIGARARYAERHSMRDANLEGVASYLTVLQTRINDLQAGLPERWQIILKPAYRETLGQAVAAL